MNYQKHQTPSGIHVRSAVVGAVAATLAWLFMGNPKEKSANMAVPSQTEISGEIKMGEIKSIMELSTQTLRFRIVEGVLHFDPYAGEVKGNPIQKGVVKFLRYFDLRRVTMKRTFEGEIKGSFIPGENPSCYYNPDTQILTVSGFMPKLELVNYNGRTDFIGGDWANTNNEGWMFTSNNEKIQDWANNLSGIFDAVVADEAMKRVKGNKDILDSRKRNTCEVFRALFMYMNNNIPVKEVKLDIDFNYIEERTLDLPVQDTTGLNLSPDKISIDAKNGWKPNYSDHGSFYGIEFGGGWSSRYELPRNHNRGDFLRKNAEDTVFEEFEEKKDEKKPSDQPVSVVSG